MIRARPFPSAIVENWGKTLTEIESVTKVCWRHKIRYSADGAAIGPHFRSSFWHFLISHAQIKVKIRRYVCPCHLLPFLVSMPPLWSLLLCCLLRGEKRIADRFYTFVDVNNLNRLPKKSITSTSSQQSHFHFLISIVLLKTWCDNFSHLLFACVIVVKGSKHSDTTKTKSPDFF